MTAEQHLAQSKAGSGFTSAMRQQISTEKQGSCPVSSSKEQPPVPDNSPLQKGWESSQELTVKEHILREG